MKYESFLGNFSIVQKTMAEHLLFLNKAKNEILHTHYTTQEVGVSLLFGTASMIHGTIWQFYTKILDPGYT